jgi:alanyl-tRNA synthetase
MTEAEIREVEARVNAEVLANAATEAQVMALEDAQKSGAQMLFGEKYGDEVRVLSIGSSKELCGGTHVARTGDIGLFKITMEAGVAAGVRRIEAVTGANALTLVQQQEQLLAQVTGVLKAQPQDVLARVTQVMDSVRSLEKEVARLKSKIASAQGDDLLGRAEDVNGAKVLAAMLEGADVATLRETLDKLKDKLGSAVILLSSVAGEGTEKRVSLIAGVTADLTTKAKAGELVNFVAQQVGGKGGGRPDMAQAGGSMPEKLPAALASLRIEPTAGRSERPGPKGSSADSVPVKVTSQSGTYEAAGATPTTNSRAPSRPPR